MHWLIQLEAAEQAASSSSGQQGSCATMLVAWVHLMGVMQCELAMSTVSTQSSAASCVRALCCCCHLIQVVRLKVLSCPSVCSHVPHPLMCAQHCPPTLMCWPSSAVTPSTALTMSCSSAPWTPPMCLRALSAWCTQHADLHRYDTGLVTAEQGEPGGSCFRLGVSSWWLLCHLAPLLDYVFCVIGVSAGFCAMSVLSLSANSKEGLNLFAVAACPTG